MQDMLRVQLLSSLSSQGIPAETVATFVNTLESLDPATESELTAMLLASPVLGKGLWEVAREKAKAAQGEVSVEQIVEKEIKVFRAALAELE